MRRTGESRQGSVGENGILVWDGETVDGMVDEGEAWGSGVSVGSTSSIVGVGMTGSAFRKRFPALTPTTSAANTERKRMNKYVFLCITNAKHVLFELV